MTDTLTPGYADTDLRLGLRAIVPTYKEVYETDEADVDLFADILASTLESVLARFLPADISALDLAAALHAHSWCGEDVIPTALIPALLRGVRSRQEELGPDADSCIADYKAEHGVDTEDEETSDG